MQNNSNIPDVSQLLNTLKNQTVSSIYSNLGSWLNLSFGSDIVLSNGTKRNEFILVLWDCRWRIDSPTASIVACEDSRDDLVERIEILKHLAVASVSVSEPALDFQIEFENGTQLRVFCDSSKTDDEQWTFFMPDEYVFSVGGGGQRIYTIEED